MAVRMAVHTGEAYQPDRAHYEGPAVIRCARIRAAGHGGQVLVSDVTGALVSGRLPPGASLVEVGTVRLKGQSRPERLWQLAHSELRAAFPPVRALDQAPTNLPCALSSFVGRTSELTELAALLDAHRLVTLIGSGGCGKTRLALEAAHAVAPGSGGVWWVELARVGADAEVAAEVAAVLGVETHAGRNIELTLARQLAEADGPVLVVLDNCEHVVSAAAALSDELLGAVAVLRVVATSREPLGVAGEVTWRVPSLQLPDAGGDPSTSDAVRLFCERARSARPNLALDRAELAQVAHICRRLDGIPLALELAAARTRTMSLERIGCSLDDAFRLLAGGPRTVLARQQTIHASIDWSVDLLDEADRVVLHRLAVCAGRFDLDAAEAVAGDDQIASWDVLDSLDRLVDKSMVQFDNDGRYQLLEVVRQHGLERLRAVGALATLRDRHADHYLGLVGRLAPLGSGDEREFPRITADFANIEAALEWRLASDRPALALEAMAAVHHHPLATVKWRQRVAALDRPVPAADQLVWARAVATMTAEAPWQGIAIGDLPQRAQQTIAAAVGDRWAALLCRFGPAISQAFAGDLEPMRQVVDTARLASFDDILARALQSLGAVENQFWCFNDADVRFAEVIDLADRLDNRLMAGLARGQRALTATRLGRLDEAETWARSQDDLLIDTAGLPIAVLGEIAFARADVVLADVVLDAVSSLPDDLYGITQAMAVRRDLIAGDFTNAIARTETASLMTVAPSRLEAALELVACRRELGELERARQHLETAVAIVGQLGNRYRMARVALMSAALASRSGDLHAARRQVHTALSISVGEGLPLQTIEALEQLAILAERPIDTARLAAAASAARDRIGYRWRWPTDDRALADALITARNAIGQTAFEEATAAGARCSLPEAANLAGRARGRRGRPNSGWDALTPTEAKIVDLVAQGCTNDEIGAKLLMGKAPYAPISTTSMSKSVSPTGLPWPPAARAGHPRPRLDRHNHQPGEEMTTTIVVIDRIIIEYPDPHRAHPDETATNAALTRLAPSNERVHSTGLDMPVILAVGIAGDRPGCYCLHLNIAPTGPEGDDDQRWAPDPPARRGTRVQRDPPTPLTTKPGADVPSAQANLPCRCKTCQGHNWTPDNEALAVYTQDTAPRAGRHPRHRREPADASASPRRSRRRPNGDGPRPGRGRRATRADSARLAHTWGSPSTMAACTLTRPAHRSFDRRVSAVLVVAIAVTALLVGHSQRQPTTTTETSPAVSTPPRVKSGFTGTMNTGPGNPNDNMPSTTRTITADDRRAITIGARALGVNVDTLTAMVLADPTPRSPTVLRSVVDQLDQRRVQGRRRPRPPRPRCRR